MHLNLTKLINTSFSSDSFTNTAWVTSTINSQYWQTKRHPILAFPVPAPDYSPLLYSIHEKSSSFSRKALLETWSPCLIWSFIMVKYPWIAASYWTEWACTPAFWTPPWQCATCTLPSNLLFYLKPDLHAWSASSYWRAAPSWTDWTCPPAFRTLNTLTMLIVLCYIISTILWVLSDNCSL